MRPGCTLSRPAFLFEKIMVYLLIGKNNPIRRKMNEEKKETAIKFGSKAEITHAIQVLTALCPSKSGAGDGWQFAIEKVQELTKLL